MAQPIAVTTGRNATTLQRFLNSSSHDSTLKEFGEILELTKDRRILDAVHASRRTTWRGLAEAYAMTCQKR